MIWIDAETARDEGMEAFDARGTLARNPYHFPELAAGWLQGFLEAALWNSTETPGN